jgi:hypothetical protein
MKRFHLVVWVGPTQVAPLAEKFREAGVTVTVEGTERVHAALDSESWDDAPAVFLEALWAKHETAFGFELRDVRVTREEPRAAAARPCDCGDYCAYCHPEMCC